MVMMMMTMMMVAMIIIIMVVVVVVVLGDLSDAVHSGWGDDGFLHAQVHVATTQQPSRRPSHLWACVDRIGTCRRGVLHHVVSRTYITYVCTASPIIRAAHTV